MEMEAARYKDMYVLSANMAFATNAHGDIIRFIRGKKAFQGRNHSALSPLLRHFQRGNQMNSLIFPSLLLITLNIPPESPMTLWALLRE